MSTQLYKPLISENQRDEDDIKHFYNENLGSSFHHHDYLSLKDDVEAPYEGDDQLPQADKNTYKISITAASNDVLSNQV